ncbi:Immunoglobulin Heavy Constant Alpha 1 [Manis pentadactyla]|nr:Immunoglobulin Heavy Constant Alpha 1 [Manis pentadactyla]
MDFTEQILIPQQLGSGIGILKTYEAIPKFCTGEMKELIRAIVSREFGYSLEMYYRYTGETSLRILNLLDQQEGAQPGGDISVISCLEHGLFLPPPLSLTV